MSGLALSIPGLFLTCVNYFELIQLGRNFKPDFASCAIRLDAARIHLLRWGKAAEIIDTDTLQERLAKYKESDVEFAKDLLEQIKRQFERAEEDSGSFKRLKARKSTPLDVDETKILNAELEMQLAPKDYATAHKALVGVKSGYRKALGAVFETHDRTRWALYQKKNLNSLVDEVSKLVSELEKLFPEIPQQETKLASIEVASMENSTLQLLPELLGDTDPVLAAAVESQGEERGLAIRACGLNVDNGSSTHPYGKDYLMGKVNDAGDGVMITIVESRRSGMGSSATYVGQKLA